MSKEKELEGDTSSISQQRASRLLYHITLQQAEKAIAAAQRESQKRGELAAFAVMDTGGNLVAFSRMNGANLMTIDVALGKAYTASISNLDTIDVNPFIQPGQALFGMGLVLQQARSLVPFAGGIVLRQQGELIGSLGVSGARTAQIDHEIAQSALAEFEQV